MPLLNVPADAEDASPESTTFDQSWFVEDRPSSLPFRCRASLVPVTMGEFLGEPLADAWLR